MKTMDLNYTIRTGPVPPDWRYTTTLECVMCMRQDSLRHGTVRVEYLSAGKYSAKTNGNGTCNHVRRKPMKAVTASIPLKSNTSRNMNLERIVSIAPAK